MAQQLLTRYGMVTRETAAQENLPGGFSAVYDVLKALEESGKVRRGYFAAELGATQFALPAAVDLLRSLRTSAPAKAEMVMLAATDPANPWGSVLRWPEAEDAGASLTRSVGAQRDSAQWGVGGVSAAEESESAGVFAGGGAGPFCGGSGFGGISGGIWHRDCYRIRRRGIMERC